MQTNVSANIRNKICYTIIILLYNKSKYNVSYKNKCKLSCNQMHLISTSLTCDH